MSKAISIMLGAALLAAIPLAAREARADAAEACVPAKVVEALADCSAAAPSPPMSVADLLAAVAQLQSQASTGNLPGGKKSRGKGQRGILAAREFDDAEKKLAGAFQRFLCEDKPAPGDAKALEQHVAIEYAQARLYFQANHFEEAAAAFRAIALHRADAPVGIYASQLYLESLNVLANPELTHSEPTPPGRASCFDAMARDVPTFVGLYCKDGKEKVNVEECGTLGKIQRDILRLRAEDKVKEADRESADGFDGSALYEAAAAMYLQIWEQHGRAGCEAKSPSCEHVEEILYNAARAYQAARLIDKAIATRKVLIDPRYHLDTTELGKKALYEIGGNYQAMAIHDEAAFWYESFARNSPKMPKAPEALMDAVVLRLGLGQLAQADADADQFSKLYGSRLPRDTAKIAFAVASHVLDQGDRAGAKRRFEAAMAMIDKNARVEIQIQAHAGLGRALAELGKAAPAAAEYGKVRALFRDPAGVLAKMDDADEPVKDRALARALTVLGEATFFFAEEKRRAAAAIPLPVYRGTGRREDVAAFVSGALAPWLVQRRQAIEAAEKGYLEVLAIQPVPPPKWVVASAAQVARMHGLLAAQLRSVPLPKSWKQRGPSPWGPSWEEIRAEWDRALDQASAPVLTRAKSAYRSCVDLSVKYQTTDARSRACGAWLSRHYPAEYPKLDEITDRPSHVAFAIESRPAPARR